MLTLRGVAGPTLRRLEGIPPVRFGASWVAFALVALALAGLGLAAMARPPAAPESIAPTVPEIGVTPLPRGDLPIIGDPIRDLTVWYSNRVSDANRASLENHQRASGDCSCRQGGRQAATATRDVGEGDASWSGGAAQLDLRTDYGEGT